MGLISKEIEASKIYDLELDKESEFDIVALTRDNVARIEAIIRLDSSYRDSNDETKGIKYKNKSEDEVKYNGSSAYWLKQLKGIIYTDEEKYNGHSYKNIISHLVIAIDIENSTHLNSDNKIGRDAVIKRLLGLERQKLIDYLKNPGNEYELINIIKKREKKGEKTHFSFATKFCHYACMYLFKGEPAEDNFSIYDNVLKKCLPMYIKRYLAKDVKETDYENDYAKYIEYIDLIRKKAANGTDMISRNGFDHLLWYYHKGRN